MINNNDSDVVNKIHDVDDVLPDSNVSFDIDQIFLAVNEHSGQIMTNYFKLNDKKKSWLLINYNKIRMLHGNTQIITVDTFIY